MTNIALFPGPASKKTLESAKKWVQQRRQATDANRQRNSALLASIMDDMRELGVEAVEIGGKRIDLTDGEAGSGASGRWSEHVSSGGQLYVMDVSTAYSGYAGNEQVDPESYPLEELVDLDRISQVAPGTVVFGPGQETPWNKALVRRGFQLWISSQEEMAALWASMDTWVKTRWHDEKLDELKARGEIPHAWHFEKIAWVCVRKILAPDLDLRIARHARVELNLEAIEEMGELDREAQENIKRAIGGLVGLEQHPVLGSQATEMIDELLPGLALVMDGKQRYKKLEAQERALRTEINQAYAKYTVDYAKRPASAPSFD